MLNSETGKKRLCPHLEFDARNKFAKSRIIATRLLKWSESNWQEVHNMSEKIKSIHASPESHSVRVHAFLQDSRGWISSDCFRVDSCFHCDPPPHVTCPALTVLGPASQPRRGLWCYMCTSVWRCSLINNGWCLAVSLHPPPPHAGKHIRDASSVCLPVTEPSWQTGTERTTTAKTRRVSEHRWWRESRWDTYVHAVSLDAQFFCLGACGCLRCSLKAVHIRLQCELVLILVLIWPTHAGKQ